MCQNTLPFAHAHSLGRGFPPPDDRVARGFDSSQDYCRCHTRKQVIMEADSRARVATLVEVRLKEKAKVHTENLFKAIEDKIKEIIEACVEDAVEDLQSKEKEINELNAELKEERESTAEVRKQWLTLNQVRIFIGKGSMHLLVSTAERWPTGKNGGRAGTAEEGK